MAVVLVGCESASSGGGNGNNPEPTTIIPLDGACPVDGKTCDTGHECIGNVCVVPPSAIIPLNGACPVDGKTCATDHACIGDICVAPPSMLTVTGTVAIGARVQAADVDIACGSTVRATTTNNDGTYSMTIDDRTTIVACS